MQAKFYLQRQVSMRKKGANILRIFDGNSIKANSGMEKDTAMVLVSADSALIREGKCTAYGNLGKF